jgi:hypothetical protein
VGVPGEGTYRIPFGKTISMVLDCSAGVLQKLEITQESFDGSFVAIPEEFDPAQMRADLL